MFAMPVSTYLRNYHSPRACLENHTLLVIDKDIGGATGRLFSLSSNWKMISS
jgi:hypothetical protein